MKCSRICYQSTQQQGSEGSILQTHCCDNRKSHAVLNGLLVGRLDTVLIFVPSNYSYGTSALGKLGV